jgi:hypothetical protein
VVWHDTPVKLLLSIDDCEDELKGMELRPEAFSDKELTKKSNLTLVERL